MSEKILHQLSPREKVLYQHMIENPIDVVAAASMPLLVRRLWRYRRQLSGKKAGKIISLLISTSLFEPYRWAEKLRMGRIHRTEIKKAPVFILGAYRSGTTHLHSLMTQNQELTYPDSIAITVPEAYRTAAWLIRFLAKKSKAQYRPIDQVPLTLEAPQETQIGLLNMMGPVSTEFLIFPSDYPSIKNLGVIHECSASYQRKWKRNLLIWLKKLTYWSGGKRIVLKNPPDTANIPTLLELFPEAKFIFIHRDPWELYASMVNTFRAMAYHLQLENNSYSELTDLYKRFSLDIYSQLIKGYLKHRDLIPAGNLVEIGYRELTGDRVGKVQAIRPPWSQIGWKTSG